MVLPMLLEMLGCPAWLFLDQWQRVNGCRCVAKEGSEIPTDPGRSKSSTCRLVCCPVHPFKCLFLSLHYIPIHRSLSSSVRLPTCLSFLPIHHHLILRPYLLLNFHNSLTPLCWYCSHPRATSWTGFWKLNAKFIRTAFEHIHSLSSFHSAHAVLWNAWLKVINAKSSLQHPRISFILIPDSFLIFSIWVLLLLFFVQFVFEPHLYPSLCCSLVESLAVFMCWWI